MPVSPAIVTSLAVSVGAMGPLGRATLNAGVKVGGPVTWRTGWFLEALYGNLVFDFIPIWLTDDPG